MTNRSIKFKEELVEENFYEDDSIGDELQETKRQFNKFQSLNLIQDQDPIDDIDEEKSNNSDSSHEDHELDRPQQTSSSKQKKRRRKNKNKSSKNSQFKVTDPFEDNSSTLMTSQQSNLDVDSPQEVEGSLYQLLKVESKNLIPENELKRMFGKSILKEEHKQRHHNGLGGGNQKSRFVSAGHPDSRLLLLSSGPRMELDDLLNNSQKQASDQNVSVKNADSGRRANKIINLRPTYFRFVHDKSYQAFNRIFFASIDGLGDSEAVVQNLSAYPIHVESLLQISDMLRVSEDYKAASELIERALIIFESGFHQRFNFAQANCRLSYKRPENRTFFITIFKHIVYCNRRGLRRTPLEYTKLLLSLDPENDPLFAALMIDFYALRSGEYDYLIDFIIRWKHLSKLPNMKFSLALAYFMKSSSKRLKQGKASGEENLKLADERLQEALLSYPNFIISLLNACSAEPDSGLKDCEYFDYSVYGKKYKTVPEAIELLVNLYVQRTCLLFWKTESVSTWLEKNVAVLVQKFAAKELVDNGQHIEFWSGFKGPSPRNLLRHIVLSDLDTKIPPTAAAGSTLLDIDPFPPESIISYQRNSDSNATLSSSQPQPRGMSSLFIRSILPSFGLGENPRATRSGQSPSEAQPIADPANDAEAPINLDSVHQSIQNVLSSLSNLIIRTENSTPDNHENQHDNNQQ